MSRSTATCSRHAPVSSGSPASASSSIGACGWAITTLLGDRHPITRDSDELRLNDHGCEIVNSSPELYFAVAHAHPDKRAYEAPVRELYDRLLEVGRNEDRLLWHVFNPKTGANRGQLCDTWGYNYDGVYTVFLVDGVNAYRDAVRHVLANLGPKYYGRPWADKSQDGIADAVEGALNLYNREPIPAASAWIDHQMRLLWACQQPDGTIERWHGDGNYARTTIMYVLWKSQGLHLDPWRPDVRVGAVRSGDTLFIHLASDQPWTGLIRFDRPRHREFLKLPLDYPRINQFPEWFAVEKANRYEVRVAGTEQSLRPLGVELMRGFKVSLDAGEAKRLEGPSRAVMILRPLSTGQYVTGRAADYLGIWATPVAHGQRGVRRAAPRIRGSRSIGHPKTLVAA